MKERGVLLFIILILLLIAAGYCQAGSTGIQPPAGQHAEDPTLIATNAGIQKTEGDLLVRSNGSREAFGAAGRNVRVGVIGNGAESLNLSRQTGEVGDVQVLAPGTGDEGTAMLEIIHDIAPDADLSFHAYGGSSDAFKTAVTALADAGCDIICDDLCFFHQPFLQDGDVAAHIRQTLMQHPGLIYVTVSGNFALLHYQGSWRSSGDELSGGILHDFSDGDTAITITLLPTEYIIATLQWDDPWDRAVNDYDLILTSQETGEIISESRFVQNITSEPFEHLVYNPEGPGPETLSLSIIRNGESQDPGILELFIRGVDPGGVQDSFVKDPRDSVFGHAAIEEVVTVGSVDASAPFTISPDSSQGPVTIRYPDARRWKPDICAPTNVNVSGAGDFPSRFPGTSAAAPHVAGVIAQLWSAFPDLSRDDLIHAVYEAADDLGAPGWDATYGYGLLNAERAYRILYDRSRASFTGTGPDPGV